MAVEPIEDAQSVNYGATEDGAAFRSSTLSCAVKRPAPTVAEVWAAAPDWLRERQQEALAAMDDDILWAREPQETYSPDATFEELPDELSRQCCVGKTCGTTDLLKSKSAALIGDEAVVIYSYVRKSNGDSYFSATAVEDLVRRLNDPEYWPNSY